MSAICRSVSICVTVEMIFATCDAGYEMIGDSKKKTPSNGLTLPGVMLIKMSRLKAAPCYSFSARALEAAAKSPAIAMTSFSGSMYLLMALLTLSTVAASI